MNNLKKTIAKLKTKKLFDECECKKFKFIEDKKCFPCTLENSMKKMEENKT